MTAPSLGYLFFSSISRRSIRPLHIAPTILCVAPLYPTTSSAALQAAYAVALVLVISAPRSVTQPVRCFLRTSKPRSIS